MHQITGCTLFIAVELDRMAKKGLSTWPDVITSGASAKNTLDAATKYAVGVPVYFVVAHQMPTK